MGQRKGKGKGGGRGEREEELRRGQISGYLITHLDGNIAILSPVARYPLSQADLIRFKFSW